MELVLNSYLQQKCSQCGASLSVSSAINTVVCEYCGATYTVKGQTQAQPVPEAVSPSTPNAFEIRSGFLIKYNGSTAEVVIPDGVKEIGESAFAQALTVERVVIPQGVKKIRKRAFVDCSYLTHVEIPASVEEIDRTAFTLSDTIYSEGTRDSPTLKHVKMDEAMWFRYYTLFPYAQEGRRLLHRQCEYRCLRCGNKIGFFNGKCSQCGILAEYNNLVCYYCGEKIKSMTYFCLKCGRNLSKFR